MARRVGLLLMLTGVGHFLLGFALFHAPFAAIARDGVLLYFQGQVASHALGHGDAALLRILGWNLVATGAAGAAIMPVSGFWLVIAFGALVLRDARRVLRWEAP